MGKLYSLSDELKEKVLTVAETVENELKGIFKAYFLAEQRNVSLNHMIMKYQ